MTLKNESLGVRCIEAFHLFLFMNHLSPNTVVPTDDNGLFCSFFYVFSTQFAMFFNL